MHAEQVPSQPSPEQPPLAPYDPPDPAPQATARAQARWGVFGAPTAGLHSARANQRRARGR